MASEEWSKRVVSALHALGKRRFGALTEAEKKAQVFPSYVRKRKDAGTIDLRKMLAVLEALNEHPARFFRRVFPGRENDYRTFVDSPTGPQPDIIEQAQRRLASTRHGSISRAHLEDLDALRFEKPHTTLEGVLSALAFIDHADVPFALGVWASAQRQLALFDDATHALLAGLSIAESQQDLRVQGILLQRLSYIVADHGEYEAALSVGTLATDAYAQAGNLHAIGRSMVDRGRWFFHLDRFDEANALQEQAITLLAGDDDLFQVAARQYLGLGFNALGNQDAALQAVAAAWSYAGAIGISAQSKLTWLEALIEAERGNISESESKLKGVVSTFVSIHFGEAAMATIDLAEVQLEAGKPSSAYQSAQEILPLITPLGVRHKIVRSAELALVDLARRGSAGMSVEAVAHLRSLLEHLKRERQTWRSLGTAS